jgi:hypothetical protein
MQVTSIGFVVVGLSVMLTGCGSREAPWEPGGFGSRLDAAKAINNSATRDEALRQVAIDAAASEDGDTARKAVEAINNSATKDAAASRAALRLAKVGRGDDANAVARLIGNSALRDSTLAKIAKGDFGD